MKILLAFTDSDLREFLDVALLPVLLVMLIIVGYKAFTE